MRRLMNFLLLSTAVVSMSAFATGLRIRYTTIQPENIVVSDNDGNTEQTDNALLSLGNAQFTRLDANIVLLDFDGFRILDAAGAVIEQGNNTRGVTRQYPDGSFGTVFVAPLPEPDDETGEIECSFNGPVYSSCFAAVSCGNDPQCVEAISTACEDLASLGCLPSLPPIP